MRDSDSPLLQLPHITPDLAKRCAEKGVSSVFELAELEDEARRELLQMTDKQLGEVAIVCNR
jgi:pre-mRNA-splicing helicase BRR2